MATFNIGGASSYTISLDSLDLTYISKYVNTPKPEKMPLWTKERLDGESEYCQVEIVTCGNNNEDCYSEPTDTYQCHICNINMPKNCYQRHNESNQHETFMKINQKVLERVSKQKYVISMNTDEGIGCDSYYCEPCSKIVEIGNKNNHEATDYHAKSVKDSIIINEFYKLLNENFSNDVNEEVLEEEIERFNANDSYDMYYSCTSMEASSSDESDDNPDQISTLVPAPGNSIIETNLSPKEEVNEELLEKEGDHINPKNNYDMYDNSIEASSSHESDDNPDQNSTLAPAPGNSIIETNQSPKLEVNEELLDEERDPFIPKHNYDMYDKSIKASSSDENDDNPDQNSTLSPAPGNSIIEIINPSHQGEETEELLDEERDSFNPKNNYDIYDNSIEASSSNESDDHPDQNNTLAPATENNTVETVNKSPNVEEEHEELSKEGSNPNNSYDMYDNSIEANSSHENNDNPDQNSTLAPAPGNSIIETNQSPKVEVNEELLDEERDPINPKNNYDMYDNSIEASSSHESDDNPDQINTLAPAPGNNTVETVNQSPKVEEEHEELLKEGSNPNNSYEMYDKSIEASISNENDDNPDQISILVPAPGNSIIEINQSPKVEVNEELLEKEGDHINQKNNYDMYDNSIEASSSDESDDNPDQNGTLAPAPGNNTVETVNKSPKEHEELLKEGSNPNNSYDMYDKSVEASSSDENDDNPNQTSIVAPAPGNSSIEIINASPKEEVNEELLEKEGDHINPKNNYDMYDKSIEDSNSDGNENYDNPDQNSTLAPAPGNSTVETVNKSPKVEETEELLDEERDPINSKNNYDMYDNSIEASNSNENDDNPDQNNTLAPAPGNNTVETVNKSPNVEENDMYDSCTNMEESSTNKSDEDDDLIDLNSFLALVPGKCIETVKESPYEEDTSVEVDNSFEEYLKKMLRRYNLEVTPPLSVYGNFITLVAPNGDRVKVCRENFHGYVVIRENTYCQICNMGIWGTDDTSEHDITEQHVRNLFRPINNSFARRLGKTWSHCIPCNALVVADSDLHALKLVHKQIIDSTQIPDKTRCEDCSIYVDSDSFTDHLTSETHLHTLELIEQNSIHDFGNNEVFCMICNETLPKYALNFHIGTEPHLSRKANDSTVVSNENNDTTINDDSNASSTTNDENNAVTINDEQNAATINDEQNAATINDEQNAATINDVNDENIASTKDAPTEIIDKNDSHATGVNDTGARFCEMCKARLPGESSSANINGIKPRENEIDELWGTSANTGSSYSVAGTSTMSNRSDYPYANNYGYAKFDNCDCRELIEFVDQEGTIARCKICFVEMPYSERNLMGHVRGRSHLGVLQIWEQYEKLNLENRKWYNKEQMEKYNKKVVRKYTKLLFISHCVLKCEICDVNVAVDEKSLLSHTRGKKHVIATNYHYYQNGRKL